MPSEGGFDQPFSVFLFLSLFPWSTACLCAHVNVFLVGFELRGDKVRKGSYTLETSAEPHVDSLRQRGRRVTQRTRVELRRRRVIDREKEGKQEEAEEIQEE